jgi:PsbP
MAVLGLSLQPLPKQSIGILVLVVWLASSVQVESFALLHHASLRSICNQLTLTAPPVIGACRMEGLCMSTDVNAELFSATTTATILPTSRRKWLLATTAAASSLLLPLVGPTLPAIAAVATTSSFTTFKDDLHGFSIKIPTAWTALNEELFDRRKLLVWTDPSTPVRDDYTSLGSFGSVDQVAAQTILPKGRLMNENDKTDQAKLISAVSAKQAYIFDYIQATPSPTDPKSSSNTHFRTIFTLIQGATGGAGAVLVTITAQTPEARYSQVQATLDAMIESYGKAA